LRSALPTRSNLRRSMPLDPAATLHAPDEHGLPRVSFWTRVHFFWALAFTALTMVPCTAAALAHNAFRPTARTFKLWATLWARLVLMGAGVKIQSDVRAALGRDEPAVFVANHQNELDIVTLLAGIPYPFGFMAKAELRRVPVLGSVLKRTACLFVDRSDARRAVQSIHEAAERIREGNSVLVFCEGARSFSSQLLPFLRGAFVLAVEAGVPVVPVTIIDNYRLLDERRAVGRVGTVRMVVGEAVSVEGKSRSDVPALMAAVEASMQAELDRAHGVSCGPSPSSA
jgi:1-acyl-sn-glycerol-3-phosphate acyltransferase